MSYDPVNYWSSLHDREPGGLSAVGYAALGTGFNRVAYRRRLSAARALLRRLLGSDQAGRVLEAAVGVGAYAPLWRELGVRDWVGLDISTTAISNLQQRFPRARFLHVDIATTAAPTWSGVGPHHSFDIVTAIDVLYHLTDDAACNRALLNLASFVRSGGVLVISDVFVERPYQRIEHVKRRPLDFYRDALAAANLFEVARQPVFGLLGDPVPRAGFHVRDFLLFSAWRVIQKAIRVTPAPLRNSLGSAAAWTLFPLDIAICQSGIAEGINLELAAFRVR